MSTERLSPFRRWNWKQPSCVKFCTYPSRHSEAQTPQWSHKKTTFFVLWRGASMVNKPPTRCWRLTNVMPPSIKTVPVWEQIRLTVCKPGQQVCPQLNHCDWWCYSYNTPCHVLGGPWSLWMGALCRCFIINRKSRKDHPLLIFSVHRESPGAECTNSFSVQP